jgi:type IV secretory pathway VirB3-like protein
MSERYTSSDDWEEVYRKSLTRVAVWFGVAVVAAILTLVGLFLLRQSLLSFLAVVLLCIAEYNFVRHQGHRLIISFWIKRLRRGDKAIAEYAAMVQWQCESLGLEPVSPLEFRRKTPLVEERTGLEEKLGSREGSNTEE